ncbi:hypothetical protein oki298_03120 [Helicobacter pylori]
MISKHSLSFMKFVIKQNLKKRVFKSERMAKNLKLKRAKARELNYKLSKTFWA